MVNLVGAPIKFTPKELDEKFQEFLDYCKKNYVPLTIGRLCVILNVDRDFLLDHGKQDKYATQIRRYRMIILADKEERLNAGKGSTAGTIFDLKNNYGWTDRQEIDHKGEMPFNILFKQEKKEIDITPKPKQIEQDAEKYGNSGD